MPYTFTSPKPAYTLAWPREVLAWELDWVLKTQGSSLDTAELLLEEAFVSDEPRDELKVPGGLGWGVPTPTTGGRALLERLREVLDQLPERSKPRPYWSQRQQAGQPHVPGRTMTAFGRRRVAWTDLVSRYLDRGYFDNVAPRECVDQDEPPQVGVLEERTRQLLQVPGLWPLKPESWDEDTFYSLIEVVGDLVARPRARTWHSYASCGWHYEQFATVPGQMLYRAEVNDLLAGSGLELASDGEDAGRLVRTVDDGRSDLLDRVMSTTQPGDVDAVVHATALFRARTADREAKRSAVVALAGVLESRRGLLEDALDRKQDVGPLFHIANKFDLRHRRADQYAGYDEAYLDWIFWWYVATIELSDRLLAHQTSAPS